MAERVLLSPGVYSREIEVFPGRQGPVGTPAGAIGSSLLGPAFVPITVGNFDQFISVFGNNVDGERQGVIAAREFLRNGTAFTYCRVLGAGIGGSVSSVTVGTSPISYYESAGFIAGKSNLNGVSSTDVSGSNVSGSHFWKLGHAVQDVDLSSLYLDNFVESAGTPLSSSAQLTAASRSSGILYRASVLTSGSANVYLYSGTTATSALSGSGQTLTSATLGTAGGLAGSILSSNDVVTRQQFVISVGTPADPDAYFGPITCSMDPSRGDYFANILNTDPDLFGTKGHILYSRYDVDPTVVTMSGTGQPVVLGDKILPAQTFHSGTSFVAKAYSSGTVGAVRTDNFGSRFQAPISPMVISQNIGGDEMDLFQIESLHDGYLPGVTFKISIANIVKPNVVSADPYGTFSLLVRAFNDTDQNPIFLEQYNGCNLNPNSENFVCRKVGTQKTYFDFNQANEEDRKLVTEGDFETRSNYIRVVPTEALLDGRIPKSALPWGFTGPSIQADSLELVAGAVGQSVPPIPFRQTIARGAHSSSRSRRRDLGLYWGVQFQNVEIPSSGNGQSDPNSSRIPNAGIEGFIKLYGLQENLTMVTGSRNDSWAATGYNADTYNRNKFTLDNVALMSDLATGYTTSNMQNTTLADAKFYRYLRAGVSAGTASLGDLLNLSGPSAAASYNRIASVAKFSFFVAHGFDGTNFQNRESRLLSNNAIRNAENNVTSPGGLLDNTVNAYLHGIQIMSNKDDVAINLFAMPGIKQAIVTDRAIDAIESNFDALYIMDIDDRLETSPDVVSSVGDVLETFEARSLDSSFAAAYYPDLIIAPDPNGFGRRQTIAPSAAVLGAFAYNDRVANPFQVAAGFNRGVLDNVIGTTQRLTQDDRDDLYSRANINPIFQSPGRPFVIFGNKTLNADTDSALTRISTRRLMIEIRRAVRRVADNVLFDQNNQAALDRLNKLINPILERIQAQGGIQQYAVVINDQTTGQIERENNTIAGQIRVQPTNVVEFIALDFVVDQSGVTFL